jgi:HK97 family phage portal protein
MNPFQRVGSALKAFAMTFAAAGARWYWSTLGRTRFDYAREVGSGRGNAAVMACVLWFCRAFPEAPLRTKVPKKDGWEFDDEQPFKKLIDNPNPFYSGELLWWATTADWMFGNAYWLKVRSGSGRPVELWWCPSTLIEPKWPLDGSVFISHYEYSPNGRPERVEVEDVVHFRYGLDPLNPRKGLSPLGALLREVFTDDEAASYTATMLRNVGVPPVVIAPKVDKDGNAPKVDQAEADSIKTRFQEIATGDERGKAIVMRGATDITTLGFNPQQMDVKALRRIPEERISAIFGTPAVVVGLGAGLDRSTFANFAEAREAAYESNVIPSQRLLAAELRTQLLPDFATPGRLQIVFDLAQVRVLQTDQNELHTRAREDLKAGMITRNRALAMIGEDQDLDGDVLYIPIGITPTDPADLLAETPMPAVPALPASTGQPAKVLRLPRGRKDTGAVGAAMQRLRARLQPKADRAMQRFLSAQLERAVGRLAGAGKAAGDAPNPEDVLPPDEEQRLRRVLRDLHQRALQGVHALAEDALGVSFDLDDPTTRAYLADAGVNIKDIHQTTLDALRAALQTGQAEGEGISELAARLRDLPAFNQARATLVARTELGHASNLAAVHSYRASGVVVGVQVLDGDFDSACAAMNGRTFTLDQVPATLQHPNCTRAFLPLTDASQLEVAA